MGWSSIRSKTVTFVRENIVRRFLPNSVVGNLHRNDRGGAIYRAWGHVYSNRLEGAYYEFGVYRGERFREAYRFWKMADEWLRNQLNADEMWRRSVAVDYVNTPHHFYAFDTFEGMPENGEGNAVFAAGNFRCMLEEFVQLNRRAGIVEGPLAKYFVGMFSDIAKRDAKVLAESQAVAIANIDCDLYGSTMDALAIIAPKLQQGSVLLIDDWNQFSSCRDKGQRRAVREFLASHPEVSFEPWFTYEYLGQAFLVHRGGNAAVVPEAAVEEHER